MRVPVLVNEKIDALLETTSRSFYPTLKYLPKKTRGQIGLLYPVSYTHLTLPTKDSV